MTLEFYLAWLAVVFPLVYSPGPGNVLCAISGAANTFAGSLPFIFGLNLSYATYSLLIGFGMGAVIQEYAGAFYYVQILGCLYIFYLAAAFFFRKAAEIGAAKKLSFKDGVIAQALNIKGVSIVVLIYSQFLSEDGGLAPQVLILTAMLASLNLFTHCSWALGGWWLISKLASDGAAKIQNRIYGVMLFSVAVWLLPVWE